MQAKKLMRFSAFCLPSGVCVPKPDSLPDYEFETVMQGGIQMTFLGAIVLTLILLIYSGIQIIMSRGEKIRLEAAKNRFTYALLGLIVILLAFFITNTVLYMFGLTLLG